MSERWTGAEWEGRDASGRVEAGIDAAGAPDRAGSTAGGRRLSASSRVEAFSDGVLAIVMTLLVLDLRIPIAEHESTLSQLLDQWPTYLAYLASFGYVGVIWVNHHQLFTRIGAVDSGLLWCNLALLLATSVLPFPTAVLGRAFQTRRLADEITGVVVYAVVATLMAAAWLLLFHYLSRHERLLARHVSPSFFAAERRRALLGVLAYPLAAVVALWEPIASLVILCALPVFYGLTSEGWRWGRREASQ